MIFGVHFYLSCIIMYQPNQAIGSVSDMLGFIVVGNQKSMTGDYLFILLLSQQGKLGIEKSEEIPKVIKTGKVHNMLRRE